MSLPASIRLNVGAPFPAQTKGSGPIKITKQNGIWTVQMSPAGLGILQVGSNPTAVQVLVYNTITGLWQYTTLAGIQSGGLATTSVTHAGSPYAPLVADFFLACDSSAGAIEIDMPPAAQRGGVALSIKDVAGAAKAANITIKPQVGETIDGYTNAAPLILASNYAGVKLVPLTGKYTIAP